MNPLSLPLRCDIDGGQRHATQDLHRRAAQLLDRRSSQGIARQFRRPQSLQSRHRRQHATLQRIRLCRIRRSKHHGLVGECTGIFVKVIC